MPGLVAADDTHPCQRAARCSGPARSSGDHTRQPRGRFPAAVNATPTTLPLRRSHLGTRTRGRFPQLLTPITSLSLAGVRSACAPVGSTSLWQGMSAQPWEFACRISAATRPVATPALIAAIGPRRSPMAAKRRRSMDAAACNTSRSAPPTGAAARSTQRWRQFYGPPARSFVSPVRLFACLFVCLFVCTFGRWTRAGRVSALPILSVPSGAQTAEQCT